MTEPSKPRKLRVLQVLPSLVSGGVERGTLDLCSYLIKQGHEAWVITSGGPLVASLEKMGARHIHLPAHSKNPFIIWKNSHSLFEIIKKHDIDIVHVRSRAPAWSCYWASKRASILLITTFHGQYGHQNALKRIYNSSMLKGDRCIAVSEFIAKHIKDTYPQHKTQIILIKRGIDLNYFSKVIPIETLDDLRAKWGIHREHKVIILPGRLTRIKGHKVFLEALAKLIADSTIEKSSIRCLIVGDETGKEHYQSELINFIDSHQLSNIVKFTGNCYDMPAMYALADIAISASIKPESFGRTACEAQLMNCLVVATEHGGSLETIAPCQQQFMCQVEDSQSMADAIQLALSFCTKAKRNEKLNILKESEQFIKAHFSLERMCQETLSTYKDVLQEN